VKRWSALFMLSWLYTSRVFSSWTLMRLRTSFCFLWTYLFLKSVHHSIGCRRSHTPWHWFWNGYMIVNMNYFTVSIGIFYTFLMALQPLLLGPGLFFNFVIFFTQTVGLLGRVISPSQGLYLYSRQHKHRINANTNIHAWSRIWTYDPSVRASENSSGLRPHGYSDRRPKYTTKVLFTFSLSVLSCISVYVGITIFQYAI
jgi:hypothetical protein